jgi:hypothetical protein
MKKERFEMGIYAGIIVSVYIIHIRAFGDVRASTRSAELNVPYRMVTKGASKCLTRLRSFTLRAPLQPYEGKLLARDFRLD